MTTAIQKRPVKTELPLRNLPVSRMDELMRDVERFWERSFPFRFDVFNRMPETRRPEYEWSPRVDMFEKNGELHLRCDLPGLEKHDVEVLLDQGDLVLKGEKNLEKELQEKDMYYCERTYGSFYRRIPLGFDLDPKLVKTTFKNGVLELDIPMPAQKTPEPKRIAIS